MPGSFFRRIGALLGRDRLERDMAEEMQFHLSQRMADNVDNGMAPDEARFAAQRKFGSITQIQERAREQRGVAWLEQTGRDFSYAIRMLLKHRGFTAAAALSLALCIGANAAIFSMLHAFVLRPLPFRESGRIVEVYNAFPKVGVPKLASNLGQYADVSAHAPAFECVALWRLDHYTVGEAEGPSRVTGAMATAEWFDVVGVKPRLGRFFTAANHVPANDKVVVLTASFWESHFDADPSVIGRTLRLDGESYEIVGVAPRLAEAFDARVRLVRPFSWPADVPLPRSGYSPQLYGRLKPGATVAQAQAQASALEQRFYDTAPPETRAFFDRTGHAIKVESMQTLRAAPIASSLYLLQGGGLCVLLIGCVNVANLLLARFNARRGEFTMRIALGASRGALARQLFVESALITGVGTAAGLALAWSGLQTANHFTSQFLPDSLPLAMDGRVLGALGAVAALLALLIGLGPMLRIWRESSAPSVPTQSRSATAGRPARLFGGTLVIVQVAFALMLLTGAGLLIRSFANVLQAAPGFDSEHLWSAQIAVPRSKEKEFPSRLESALRKIPGIEVSLATATPYLLVPPYNMAMPLGAFSLRGYALPAGATQPSVYYSGASSSYLQTMRIPLRSGRWFDASDMEQGRTVVVDESFARRYFPNGDAVGQRIVINTPAPQNEEDWSQIIGVVGNVRHNGAEDTSSQPFAYLPLGQIPLYGSLSVLVRAERPAAEVVRLVRETVEAVDGELPIYRIGPIDDVIADSTSNRRGIMLLLASLAVIALMLSTVGTYGVLAYEVSQRTREIGIRGALGASSRVLAGMIVRQGMWKVGVGTAAGLAGGAAFSHFLSSLLFDVRPIDSPVYAAASVLLIIVAAIACWLPAHRAAKVDPVVALRSE